MKKTAKSDILFLLIKSLTKSEKRHFRLYSDAQNGEKIYLSLFDLYEKFSTSDAVYEKFRESHPEKNLETTSKQLYRTIMESLLKLRETQGSQTMIANTISKAEILFERELWDDAFSELKKAKKLAQTSENDPMFILIQRMELKYMSVLGFNGISEKKLVNKQMKIQETMKHIRNVNQHLQLYDTLKHRIVHQENVYSDKQKLNDLVLSELHLAANHTYTGFEAQKNHLLFQAVYFLYTGSYVPAIKCYKELIVLFEENIQLMQNTPIYYFTSIIDILENISTVRLFDYTFFFTSKLKELTEGAYSTEFILNVKSAIFIYESSVFLQTGEFEKALSLKQTYEEVLFNKIHLLNADVQSKLYLQTAILYLSMGNLSPAKKAMKNMYNLGKLYDGFQAYKTARLINLLLQAELRNFDFISKEISDMQHEKQTYQTEKMVLKFVRSCSLPSYEENRLKLWKQFKKEIQSINKSKYEYLLLRRFNFSAWIESKLTERAFAEVLKEKQVV